MMTKPLISITDATYQMTLAEEDKHLATVVREMTDEEYTKYLADKAADEERIAKLNAEQLPTPVLEG